MDIISCREFSCLEEAVKSNLHRKVKIDIVKTIPIGILPSSTLVVPPNIDLNFSSGDLILRDDRLVIFGGLNFENKIIYFKGSGEIYGFPSSVKARRVFHDISQAFCDGIIDKVCWANSDIGDTNLGNISEPSITFTPVVPDYPGTISATAESFHSISGSTVRYRWIHYPSGTIFEDVQEIQVQLSESNNILYCQAYDTDGQYSVYSSMRIYLRGERSIRSNVFVVRNSDDDFVKLISKLPVSLEVVILIDTPQKLKKNCVVPKNISLVFQGGYINLDGYELKLENSRVIAPRHNIFRGPGTVSGEPVSTYYHNTWCDSNVSKNWNVYYTGSRYSGSYFLFDLQYSPGGSGVVQVEVIPQDVAFWSDIDHVDWEYLNIKDTGGLSRTITGTPGSKILVSCRCVDRYGNKSFKKSIEVLIP